MSTKELMQLLMEWPYLFFTPKYITLERDECRQKQLTFLVDTLYLK